MGAGAEKEQFACGYGHKIMIEVEIILSKKSSQIICYDQT